MAPFGFQLRRAHKLLAIIIGVQLLFWTASGAFFTLYPIETIRGEHLRVEIDHGQLDTAAPLVSPGEADAIAGGGAQSLSLRMFLGRPVWQVASRDGPVLDDATTGERLTPLPETTARTLFEAGTVLGAPASVRLIDAGAPREYGGPLPAWQLVDASGTRVYIDAASGDVRAIRTDTWRMFDVLWRFHIMDITGDDRFDSWWLKLAAFLGLTSAITGLALLADRMRKGVLWR